MERRERWQPLNGKWLFSFDKPIYDREIEVPFAYQTEASGVNEKEHHETVWYKRDVILNDEMKSSERVVVRFLAVDYEATIIRRSAMISRKSIPSQMKATLRRDGG